MATATQPARACPHCGSVEITANVELSQTAEVGQIGLSYRSLGILRGTEPFLADVCRRCGTVLRLYVARTDRPWNTRK